MPSPDPIQSAWDAVHQRIMRACAQANRTVESVRLIAVSKQQSCAKILQLRACGASEFGENYLHELAPKSTELAGQGISWVYVGQLQSNKIAKIVELAAEIQTVATLKHVRYIARYAKESERTPYPIFLEVNLGDEAQKPGLSLSQAQGLAQVVTGQYPELDLQGLMAIPPLAASQANDGGLKGAGQPPGQKGIPPLYQDLAQAARHVGRGRLSLGMSGDLETAIAAGSTCIRIGEALFGPRQAP